MINLTNIQSIFAYIGIGCLVFTGGLITGEHLKSVSDYEKAQTKVITNQDGVIKQQNFDKNISDTIVNMYESENSNLRTNYELKNTQLVNVKHSNSLLMRLIHHKTSTATMPGIPITSIPTYATTDPNACAPYIYVGQQCINQLTALQLYINQDAKAWAKNIK